MLPPLLADEVKKLEYLSTPVDMKVNRNNMEDTAGRTTYPRYSRFSASAIYCLEYFALKSNLFCINMNMDECLFKSRHHIVSKWRAVPLAHNMSIYRSGDSQNYLQAHFHSILIVTSLSNIQSLESSSFARWRVIQHHLLW